MITLKKKIFAMLNYWFEKISGKEHRHKIHINKNITNIIFFEPRKFNKIELWKDVCEEQWLDANWQIKNSICSVGQLKKVIKLSSFQEKEIERTLRELKNQGKEPLRITPYYATLMQADPFHPVMLPGEKARKRLDPVFWQCVPTPANLLFPDTGAEGAMSEGTRSYGAAYQRYPNRVALFVAENTSCAAYCVHCQRAKSLDGTIGVNRVEINKGLFYIGFNKNINEVRCADDKQKQLALCIGGTEPNTASACHSDRNQNACCSAHGHHR
jgi:lysine 2,3-aminomutase